MKYWFKNPKEFLFNVFEDFYNWLPATFQSYFALNRDGTHIFYDPLILDLDGNGISTFDFDSIDFNNNAFFDFNGTGISYATAWTSTDGIINDGTEIFGNSALKQDVQPKLRNVA